MKATSMLAVHTSLFLTFLCVSLSSPILVWQYPDIFIGTYVVAAASLLALLVLGTWPLYDGKCPFTVWENQLRKRDGRPTYSGPCIDHYAAHWLGLRLPTGLSTKALIVLLLLPIFSGISNW